MLAAALFPRTAVAHVKWFEDPARFPLRPDLIASERTALTAGAVLGAVGLMYLLQRVAGDPHWPRLRFLRRMAIGAPTLLSVHAAITLVFVAVHQALLAPHLRLPAGPAGLLLAAAQILVAFSFITGVLDWLAAIVLTILVVLVAFLYSPLDALDQLLWAGIAVAVLIIGRSAVTAGHVRPWFRARHRAWSARAVAALRILAGLSLIGPALDEKIWNPDIGAAFLADYPHFNVPRYLLGLTWFSDDLFVLVAGVVEATIGVLLASGLLTRVVILGMWVPFNVTVPFLPPQELLGHLPIFGTMYVLLVHGAGIAPGEPLDQEALPGVPRGVEDGLPDELSARPASP
jgi:uncharacterized membrane protein YphA (DoxX/SURF4 family)